MSKHFSHQLLGAQRKRKHLRNGGTNPRESGDEGVLPLPRAKLPQFGFLSFSTLRRIEDARQLLLGEGDLGLALTRGCLLLAAALFQSLVTLIPSLLLLSSLSGTPTSRLCADTQPLAFLPSVPGNLGGPPSADVGHRMENGLPGCGTEGGTLTKCPRVRMWEPPGHGL